MTRSPNQAVFALFVAVCAAGSSLPPAAAETAPPPPAAGTPAATAPATSQAAALEGLKRLVDGLGYKITESGNDYIDVEDKDGTLGFSLSKDSELLYIDEFWTIPKDKIDKIPYRQLLTWNNTHSTFFAMGDNKDGSAYVSLITDTRMAGLTAQTLRVKIQDLTTAADDNDRLLDTATWK